jgi:hypothetical protein
MPIATCTEEQTETQVRSSVTNFLNDSFWYATSMIKFGNGISSTVALLTLPPTLSPSGVKDPSASLLIRPILHRMDAPTFISGGFLQHAHARGMGILLQQGRPQFGQDQRSDQNQHRLSLQANICSSRALAAFLKSHLIKLFFFLFFGFKDSASVIKHYASSARAFGHCGNRS